MEGGEKGALGQKKQTEPHETARMQGSFLFVGTAEGALYRIPCLAHTHTHKLQTTNAVTDKYCTALTASDRWHIYEAPLHMQVSAIMNY